MESLGELIRQHRAARGWSVTDLATAAGVSRAWVTRVEKGTITRPDYDTLRNVARALRVPENTLLRAAGYDVEAPPQPERSIRELVEEVLRRVDELERSSGEEADPTRRVRTSPIARTNRPRTVVRRETIPA